MERGRRVGSGEEGEVVKRGKRRKKEGGGEDRGLEKGEAKMVK